MAVREIITRGYSPAESESTEVAGCIRMVGDLNSTWEVDSRSIREQIRRAIKYGLENTVTPTNGYYAKFKKVHIERVSPLDMKRDREVIVEWGDETYTNEVEGGNTFDLYNKIAQIFIDVFLQERTDMTTWKERAIADIERYFGTYYYIPDSNGNHTAFNCITKRNRHAGLKVNKPAGMVSLLLLVYYRTHLENPNVRS